MDGSNTLTTVVTAQDGTTTSTYTVVVTYTPKALLRNSPDKGKAWADLCLAVDAIAGAA